MICTSCREDRDKTLFEPKKSVCKECITMFEQLDAETGFKTALKDLREKISEMGDQSEDPLQQFCVSTLDMFQDILDEADEEVNEPRTLIKIDKKGKGD